MITLPASGSLKRLSLGSTIFLDMQSISFWRICKVGRGVGGSVGGSVRMAYSDVQFGRVCLRSTDRFGVADHIQFRSHRHTHRGPTWGAWSWLS